jgi:1-acyl-sn-glycerol-3-phosphate acyltransferase
LASRSGKQIIPIAIEGAFAIMSRDSKRFYPGEVTMTILPPIETMKDMNKEQELLLQEQVHAAINEVLPENMKTPIKKMS